MKEMDLVDQGKLDFTVIVPDWLLLDAQKHFPRYYNIVGKGILKKTNTPKRRQRNDEH